MVVLFNGCTSDCVDCHYSGAGGRIGAGSSLGAYVRKIAALEKVDIDQDPREAVLKYAKVSYGMVRTVIGYQVSCSKWIIASELQQVSNVIYL